jgi:hypothetical protein
MVCLVLATLSCHANYLNCLLLLGIGCAAAGVCALCRSWKASLLALAICFAVAISLLPYVPAFGEYGEACKVAKYSVECDGPFIPAIGRRLAETVSGGKQGLLAGWIAVLSCASVGLVIQVLRQRGAVLSAPSLPLYFLIAAVVTSAASFVFFVCHGQSLFQWHFIPFLVLPGMMAEVAFAAPRRSPWRWMGIAAAYCVLIALNIPPLWKVTHLRRTNLDRVCLAVERNAGPNDCILVSPFWFAPGFKYHYRGSTEWNTLPLTSSDLKTSLFPLRAIGRVMMTPNAIAPTLQKIEKTLSGGNRVWIVGTLPFVSGETAPTGLTPAPHPIYGWYSAAYHNAWSAQVAYFLQKVSGPKRLVAVPVEERVDRNEVASLLFFEGLRAR